MNKITLIALGVVLAGGSFFGGMKYGESSAAQGRQTRLQGQGGQANFVQFAGGMGAGIRVGGASGSGFASGEAIAKDATGITLKMRDGGSKIIITSGSTQVMKTTSGTLADIGIGEEITAIGTTNADGSMTALSLQIRPAVQTASKK